MDWEDYRHVLALSRGRTLSRAADTLGVVRTTVSRRLQQMEDALGARLFDRTPEGFVPTAAGLELVAVAQQMEDAVLAAEARVMGRDAELSGGLRVSTMDFVYELYTDVFSSFVTRYPGVTLTVGSTTDRVSLRRREADVVIRLADEPGDHLVGRRLGEMTFAIYASRTLVDRIGADAPLQAFPWLSDDERSSSAWLDVWLAEHAPGARVVMRYDGYPVIEASVRAGIGVHFLPCAVAQRDPELVAIAPHIEPFRRSLWALTLPELRTNSRVRALLEHVYDALGESADA